MNEEKQKPQGKSRPVGHGKVFDIRRPGSATTPHTSKPVIVGHKPQVRDNVLSKEEPQRHDMTSQHKVDVNPINTVKSEHESESAHETEPKPAENAAIDPDLAAIAAELTGTAESKPEVKAETPESTVHDKPPEAVSETNTEPETEADHETEPKPDEVANASEPKSFAEFAGINKEDSQDEKSEQADIVSDNQKPPPLAEQLPGLEQKNGANVSGVIKLDIDPDPKAAAAATSDADLKPFDRKSVVVSKGGSVSVGKLILWILAVLILLAIIGDVLLDAGVIYSSVPIPHTHIISK